MKSPTLEEIKKSVAKILNEKYGFSGIADGEKVAIINSNNSDDTESCTITIKDTSE